MTLTEFLAARLDEDERVAKLAAREGGTWQQDDPDRYPGAISSAGGQVVYDEGAPDENQAPHIARHDPARALREVEAGRRMLTRHHDDGAGYCDGHPTGFELIEDCPDLRDLASAWSDHPDYDEAWRP